jgi:shikimate kinase
MTMTQTKPRRRWRTWLLALIIFIGGGVVGGAVTAVAIVHGVRHAVMHPEEAPMRIASRLKRPLDLSPQQSAQIQQIIANRQQSLMQIRRQVQPQIEGELTTLETEIAGALNPAQQTKWHSMVARLRENWLPPVAPPTSH